LSDHDGTESVITIDGNAHPNRLAERRANARQVGLPRDEPWQAGATVPIASKPRTAKPAKKYRFVSTSTEQDGRALWQMLVCDVAELRCVQRHRGREGCVSATTGFAARVTLALMTMPDQASMDAAISMMAVRPPGRCQYKVEGASKAAAPLHEPTCCRMHHRII
jgi:hypothetical protein